MTASAALEGGPAARTERAFPALDGLRALAATAVVLTHAAFATGDHTSSALGRVLAHLDVGVPVFFVLAGFLLSRPFLLAAAEGRPAPRAVPYLWRRALRILPAYWITVAAALLLLPGNDGAGPATWVRHLLLVQVYDDGGFAAGLTHTWSLCTEVAFYLVLPLAAGGLVRLGRRDPGRPWPVLAALGGVALLGLAWLVAVWTAQRTFVPTDLWLPAFSGWFAGGVALAALTVADPGWRPVRIARELAGGLGTCWAGAAVLFWIACTPVAGPLGLAAPSAGQAVTRSLLYGGVAVLLVAPLVLGEQSGRVRAALSSRTARLLGEVSYGLFLVHVVLLTGGYDLTGTPVFTGPLVLVAPATWLAGVGVAWLLYVLVERPLRRFRHVADGVALPRRRRSGSTEGSGRTEATATDSAATPSA
ncbi:acyltransferase family protein [Geodermatophilus sp. SYSU D01106]